MVTAASRKMAVKILRNSITVFRVFGVCCVLVCCVEWRLQYCALQWAASVPLAHLMDRSIFNNGFLQPVPSVGNTQLFLLTHYHI